MFKNKIILFILGFCLFVLGIAFVLVWWHDVVVVFRGMAGMILALGGLLLLFLASE